MNRNDVVERLYTRHREHAMAVALRAGAGQDAEDAVHDAYLDLLRQDPPGTAHEGYVVRTLAFILARRWRYDHRQCRDVRLTVSLDALVEAGSGTPQEEAA